ncbi:MAG: RNA methyltransferase [Chlorobi bacterium]|nr:RNA methyltransferase [Chlorobiota bacterium]
MLSKNEIKFFNSLKLRKFRIKHNLFIAEGEKLVFELLQSQIKPKIIFTSKIQEFRNLTDLNAEIIEVGIPEIKKISQLVTPPTTIGIFNIPDYILDIKEIESSLTIFCDDIQNPGNLGTIIRTADWFGIKNVLCSEHSADIYNPKTVQATMGAIASVRVHYVNKIIFFSSLNKVLPIYGTFLKGKNIYETDLSDKGIIIIGNEGKGISCETEQFVTERLFIPSFNTDNKSAESLNAAVATAVICSEFRRR